MRTLSLSSLLLVWVFSALDGTKAFQAAHYARSISFVKQQSSTQLCAVPYRTCLEIGYAADVPKPLGIVFGENPDPYYGLVVDDVAEGQNGGIAGLRVGDQLMAVNGEVVVGQDFDSVMNKLVAASGRMELVLYRGPVSAMYTILTNQLGDDEWVRDDDEGEEEIIMDENYESPVVIEVKERKPLSPADLFKAVGKVGQIMFEQDKTPPEAKEQKKKQGFFGFGAEAIQLDGDEAKGLK